MEKEKLVTDADARLMKNKNGMDTAYNIQTAVDSETHMIMNYLTTNQMTDHGLMAPTAEWLKVEARDEIIEAVADKGYKQDEDMVACLEKGIIPNVILLDGEDVYDWRMDIRKRIVIKQAQKRRRLKNVCMQV